MKKIAILLLMTSFSVIKAQGLLNKKETTFTRQDSLRGSITKERAWWDLKHYHLSIKVNPEDSTISGSNTIRYQVLQENSVMQIDLQNPMAITNVTQDGKPLTYKREGNVYFITLAAPQKVGTTKEIVVFYGGKPKVAVNPPWDGGITWKKDKNGNPFIASSCQGLGASVWWPNKDHMYDEVDEGMKISVNVPGNLTDVSNGRLQSVQKEAQNTKRSMNAEILARLENSFNFKKIDLDGDTVLNPYQLLDRKRELSARLIKAIEWLNSSRIEEIKYSLIAERLGYETAEVFLDWIQGKQEPTFTELRKIADFLGVSQDWLVHGVLNNGHC